MLFSLVLFENGHNNDWDYEPEEIENLYYLTIDTLSAERQILKYQAQGGELITREINPLHYSFMIDEGDI